MFFLSIFWNLTSSIRNDYNLLEVRFQWIGPGYHSCWSQVDYSGFYGQNGLKIIKLPFQEKMASYIFARTLPVRSISEKRKECSNAKGNEYGIKGPWCRVKDWLVGLYRSINNKSVIVNSSQLPVGGLSPLQAWILFSLSFDNYLSCIQDKTMGDIFKFVTC